MTDINARIEELARLAYEAGRTGKYPWDEFPESVKDLYRRIARILYAEIMAKDAAGVAWEMAGRASTIVVVSDGDPQPMRIPSRRYWSAGEVADVLAAKAREVGNG